MIHSCFYFLFCAADIEHKFHEFFLNTKATLRRSTLSAPQRIGQKELALFSSCTNCKVAVRRALLDDFDTPTAISLLMELVKECNRYSEGIIVSTALLSVAKYISSIMRVFGLSGLDELGFAGSESGTGGSSKEETLTPYLDVLCKFREMVRVSAMAGDSAAVLEAADALRDDLLPELGAVHCQFITPSPVSYINTSPFNL